MRSIYHTKATTAEELRTELIAELERRIAAEHFFSAPTRSTKEERAVANGKVCLLRELVQFWQEIVIDLPPSAAEGPR